MSIIRQEHPMSNQDAIERRAYQLYEQRGREDGHDWDDWLQAERELATPEAAVDQTIGELSAASPARRRRDRREATVTAFA
jgi:hypothetical protein